MPKKLFLLALVSIVLSVGYNELHQVTRYIQSDAAAYLSISKNLVAGEGYVEDTPAGEKQDAIFRVPVAYIFFLAGLRRLTSNIETIFLIQSCLVGLNLVLGYRVAWLTFQDRKVAWVTAGLFFITYDFYCFAGQALSETFSLTLVLLTLCWLLQGKHNKSKVSIAVAGILAGLAVLTRSNLLLFALLCTLWLFWQKNRQAALIYTIAVFITLAPWTIRNYLKYQRVYLTTSTLSMNMWAGNRLGGTGDFDSYAGKRKDPEYIWAYQNLDPIERDDYARAKFREILWQHPGHLAKLLLYKTLKAVSLLRTNANYPHVTNKYEKGWWLGYGVMFNCLLLIVAPLQIFSYFRRSPPEQKLLAASGLLIIASCIPMYIHARLRLSATVMLLPFVAHALTIFARKQTSWKDFRSYLPNTLLAWMWIAFVIGGTTFDLVIESHKIARFSLGGVFN